MKYEYCYLQYFMIVLLSKVKPTLIISTAKMSAKGDALVLKVQARFFLFCFLNCASSLVFFVGCKDERQDCDRLIAKTGGGEKLEKYCKKWKDEPAVKQCLATCNMCEH